MRYYLLVCLFLLLSCATDSGPSRLPSNTSATLSCNDAISLINHHARRAKNEAKRLINKLESAGKNIHLDIGGEGRYKNAINLNPQPLTSTTGEAGRIIPNWIYGRGDQLPLPGKSVHLVTIENAPVNTETIQEMMRVLRPRSEIHLYHPSDYADEVHQQIIEAFGESVISTDVHLVDQYATKTIIKLSTQSP